MSKMQGPASIGAAQSAAANDLVKVTQAPRSQIARVSDLPFLLYGIYLFCIGITMYLLGVIMVFPRYLLGPYEPLTKISEELVWYSGVPIVLGLSLALLDLLVLFDGKRSVTGLRIESIGNAKVTVALTAYNDEESISAAVADFKSHPNVARVIVVSNNSKDRTFEFAGAEGAIAFNEPAPGYGRCVFRCLSEAVKFEDTELIVLCEGDRTFRSQDIKDRIGTNRKPSAEKE